MTFSHEDEYADYGTPADFDRQESAEGRFMEPDPIDPSDYRDPDDEQPEDDDL